jgi:hypothetical protein
MKYRVIVNRIGYAQTDIEIEASSEDEARQKALDKAGDIEFREHNADYEVDGVIGN